MSLSASATWCTVSQVMNHLSKWVTTRAKTHGYLGETAAKEVQQLLAQKRQIGITTQVRAAYLPCSRWPLSC